VVSIDSTKKSIVSLGSILPYYSFHLLILLAPKKMVCTSVSFASNHQLFIHLDCIPALWNPWTIQSLTWIFGCSGGPSIREFKNTPLKTNTEPILNTTFKREHINLETCPIHFFFAFEVGIQKEKTKHQKIAI
jgi:hypothetical protein